jgi:hypothetical protein
MGANDLVDVPTKTQIKVAFRHVIDRHSNTPFEKDVFRDSYDEYRIQVQSFDPEGKYPTWTELRKEFPKVNLNVNYKTGFAIGLYVRQLENKMPAAFDNLGSPLALESHRFEILESSIVDRSHHKVAITFETTVCHLKAILGEYLLIALPNAEDGDTITVRMQPGMSVVRFTTPEVIL